MVENSIKQQRRDLNNIISYYDIFYYFIKQFFLSLPDLYSVVSNILRLVSPESYPVSYPVTHVLGEIVRKGLPSIIHVYLFESFRYQNRNLFIKDRLENMSRLLVLRSYLSNGTNQGNRSTKV